MGHDCKIVPHFFSFIYMSKQFIRKNKEDKPVVAICYDFDKTLSPDDMQALIEKWRKYSANMVSETEE